MYSYKNLSLLTLAVALAALLPCLVEAKTRSSAPKKSAVSKSRQKHSDGPNAGSKTKTRKVHWVNHYLPEDRRLITGYWTAVTTDRDTQYHRASCSRMLRQPADGVLGFPFSSDAAEAGYLPCPVCKPPSPQVSYAMVPPGSKAAYKTNPNPLRDTGGSLGDPFIGQDGQPTQQAWELFFAVQGKVGGLTAQEQQFKNSSAYATCNQLTMQTNQAALLDAATKRENRRKRRQEEGSSF